MWKYMITLSQYVAGMYECNTEGYFETQCEISWLEMFLN